MIFLRSLVFNVAFVANNILWFVLCLPLLLLPRKTFFLRVLHPWCWSNLWLHSLICGVRIEIRGRENLPEGGFIVASKHQSAWETLALAAKRAGAALHPEAGAALGSVLRLLPDAYGTGCHQPGQAGRGHRVHEPRGGARGPRGRAAPDLS